MTTSNKAKVGPEGKADAKPVAEAFDRPKHSETVVAMAAECIYEAARRTSDGRKTTVAKITADLKGGRTEFDLEAKLLRFIPEKGLINHVPEALAETLVDRGLAERVAEGIEV